MSDGRVPAPFRANKRACWTRVLALSASPASAKAEKRAGAITLHLMGLPHFPYSSETQFAKDPRPHGDFSLRS